MSGRAPLTTREALILSFDVDDGGDGTFEAGAFSSTSAAVAIARSSVGQILAGSPDETAFGRLTHAISSSSSSKTTAAAHDDRRLSARSSLVSRPFSMAVMSLSYGMGASRPWFAAGVGHAF